MGLCITIYFQNTVEPMGGLPSFQELKYCWNLKCVDIHSTGCLSLSTIRNGDCVTAH